MKSNFHLMFDVARGWLKNLLVTALKVKAFFIWLLLMTAFTQGGRRGEN